MLFSSLVFLFIFLPSVIFFYYISPKRLRNLVLLCFSLAFYAYGEPKYIFIMLLSIFINYVLGLLVDKYREDKIVKFILALTVILNLSIIGYYKYSNFLIENINTIFNLNVNLLNIVMPIGISFFTFQGLSYVIDIYRKDGKVQKNPLNVALYISLFPQLIAGPIVRYETVADDLENRVETLDKFSLGIERFILGLSKKVLISNTLGLVADEIFSLQLSDVSVVLSWIGITAYTIQIYFDFSGYSDMAIGLGKMFGFEFLENFNYPYISRSITDFWRRWHISLGTWFRDYLYIPLGGNRVSSIKFLRNILVVWFLTGLWHGSSWNFIAWGMYYGLILLIEKFFLGKYIEKLPKAFQHLYTMILVMFGWVLFRSESLSFGVDYIKTMLNLNGNQFVSKTAIYYLMEYKVAFLIAIITSMPIYPWFNKRFNIRYIKPIFLMALLTISLTYLITSTFNPFIYFRF